MERFENIKKITLNKNYFLGNKSYAKVHLQYDDRELTINIIAWESQGKKLRLL